MWGIHVIMKLIFCSWMVFLVTSSGSSLTVIFSVKFVVWALSADEDDEVNTFLE